MDKVKFATQAGAEAVIIINHLNNHLGGERGEEGLEKERQSIFVMAPGMGGDGEGGREKLAPSCMVGVEGGEMIERVMRENGCGETIPTTTATTTERKGGEEGREEEGCEVMTSFWLGMPENENLFSAKLVSFTLEVGEGGEQGRNIFLNNNNDNSFLIINNLPPLPSLPSHRSAPHLLTLLLFLGNCSLSLLPWTFPEVPSSWMW